ncbi:MAG: tetratricopeptide repeat protein, partial [Planctomycetaceae bacterium]|nr:tetratricopeptide repeat protein [Planctomycetaceae bacterium]
PNETNEAAIRATLVQVYLNEGNLVEAREEMNRLLVKDHVPPSVPFLNAMLLRLEGQLDKALSEIRSVVSNDSSPGAVMVRGLILFDQGNYKAALLDFQHVVERDPYNKEAHYKLAQCAQQAGKNELAIKHREISQRLTNAALKVLDVEPAVARDPKNPDLLRELADLYQTLGQHERANQVRRQLANF